MAIKPKQWLYDNGHLEVIGKGRMSRAHIALIEDAVRSGVNIEGYTAEKPVLATDKPVDVKRIAVDPNRVVDVPDMTRDERDTVAFYMADGKRIEIGMRTVDNNCGSSLTYCSCESPRVWVDFDRQVVVNFGTRKNN